MTVKYCDLCGKRKLESELGKIQIDESWDEACRGCRTKVRVYIRNIKVRPNLEREQEQEEKIQL